MAEERLQKVLAHAGVASRRKAEQLIVEGRVAVNGAVVTELGFAVEYMETGTQDRGINPSGRRLSLRNVMVGELLGVETDAGEVVMTIA